MTFEPLSATVVIKHVDGEFTICAMGLKIGSCCHKALWDRAIVGARIGSENGIAAQLNIDCTRSRSSIAGIVRDDIAAGINAGRSRRL